MKDDQTFAEWIRVEWWWRVSRHFEPDNLRWRVARLIPRKIALLVFVRVFAEGDPGPDYLDVYERIYRAWECGTGNPPLSEASGSVPSAAQE